MLRRFGLFATSVFIGATTGVLTDAAKKYFTSRPMKEPIVWGLVAIVALVFLILDWSFLDKDHPLKASWWYWRVFYLKDLARELDRQLHLQSQDSGILPEIVDVIEDGRRVPLGSRLLPGLRSRSEDCHRFLVLGEPGAGKTILAFQIAHRLASEAKWRFWRPMPVLLPMGGYRDGTLDAFAKQQIELSTEGAGGKVLSDGFDRLMKQKRFVFILDALDELPEAQMKRLPADLANWAKPGRGDTAFLATARAREIHPDQLQLKPLQVFRLVELSDDAVRAVVRTLKTREGSEDIYADLEKRGVLDRGGLGRNPFWLQAILDAQIGDEDRFRILDSAVSNLLLREWNKPDAKRSWTKAEEPEQQFTHTRCALGWLAYHMLASDHVAVSQDESRPFIEEAIRRRLSLERPAATDVLGLGRDALLLEYVGADVRFRHQILQSFFGANALIQESGLLDSFLATGGGIQQRWWNALLLANEFDERHPTGLHEKLLNAVFKDGREPGRIILAACLLRRWESPQGIKDALVGLFQGPEDATCVAALQAIVAVSPVALVSILRLVASPDWFMPDKESKSFDTNDSDKGFEAKTAGLLKRVIESEIQAGTAGRTLAALFREYKTAPVAGRAATMIGPAASDALLSAFAATASPEIVKALGEARIEAAVPALLRVLRGDLRPHPARGKTSLELMADPSMAGHAWLESAAIEALGKIGSSEGIPALLAIAQNDDFLEQVGAVDALFEIGVTAIPSLLSLSTTSLMLTVDTRRIAKMGPDAIPYLLRALSDSSDEVRRVAIDALGEIGDGSVARAVADHLSDHPLEVSQALASFGIEGADAIVDIVMRNHELTALTRGFLCESFERIGAQGAAPLAAALPNASSDAREFLVRALGKTHAEESARHLLPMLKDADEGTRRAVIRALGDLGKPECIQVIIDSLDDDSFLVYADCRVALAQLGIKSAIEWMIDKIEHGFPDVSDEVSTLAQRYLAGAAYETNLQEAIPILERLITENGSDRSSGFKSLLVGFRTRNELISRGTAHG
jgi:HEAT repeat protein